METVYLEQFLDCFQSFFALCLDNWPDDDTSHEQMKNAFLLSQHIEKCRDKLIKMEIITEFKSALIKKINVPSLLLENYLSNPPRYILKKIITSSANIDQMDAGFTIFLDIFSEDQLEVYLSDIMLEVASKDTLFKNISTELSKSCQSEFKSQFFLSKLDCIDDNKQYINEILKGCKQDTVDMLVLSLLNNNPKYNHAVKIVAKSFTNFMASQNVANKNFWKLLFRTEEDKFIQMCLNHDEIFSLICKALIDCGKLIEQNMSLEYFYIDITYSELSTNVQKICKSGTLKLVFLDLIYQSNVNFSFWEREIQDMC
ncbi:uncharacterized protein LOC120625149 isoform X1 [Pararge aegeria]|uniref:uncharacterized protein LOC120625149 isoform X1 n=1 Tax=Pararge aegeria TaxID=116150 RepID=UPI0019CFBC77|nr:uncharacterized protein LOC120625149 isoform X1 [Pararge aegeria]